MLQTKELELFREGKNLLAFSGGSDSTALFFLLMENNIHFDIAIVDYQIRKESKEEVAYAQKLALTYNKQCYVYKAPLIERNFEASARQIRYSFFKELIDKYRYTTLITAHHLGDRFEWMLMQFCKGAGCVELAGMQSIQHYKDYTLVRPLLHLDKSELLHYLALKKIPFFEDHTNFDLSITRNEFRHQYATPLLKKHLAGIKKSFEYLDKDRSFFTQETSIHTVEECNYFLANMNTRSKIIMIDKILKEKGYMMSASQKKMLSINNTFIVGRRYLIVQHKSYLLITPYLDQKLTMPKPFKEQMRLLKVAPQLRPYLYTHPKVFTHLQQALVL